MEIVRIGFFEDFKSSDTLLLDGDKEGLEQLAQAMRELARGGKESISFHLLPFVEIHHGVRLFASLSAEDLGTRQRGMSEFEWKRTKSGWEETADKVGVISQCQQGHHYLDAEKDEVTVMVSSIEYGKEWWALHG